MQNNEEINEQQDLDINALKSDIASSFQEAQIFQEGLDVEVPSDLFSLGENVPFQVELPPNIQNLPQMAFFTPGKQYVPTKYDIEKNKTPGFFETYAHYAFSKGFSSIGNLYRAYEKRKNASQLTELSPIDDEDIDDFRPWEDFKDRYLNVSPVFYDHLNNSKSVQDFNARYRWALEKTQEDEYYRKGNFLAKFAGGSTGLILDPINLIPVLASLKYARTTDYVIKNTLRALPGIVGSAAALEALTYAVDPDETIQDLAFNMLRDSLMATAFVGATKAIGAGFNSYKIYQARNAFNLNFQGIGAKQVIKDGVLTGFEAFPVQGSSVGAQKVKEAQAFLDSRVARTGLFAIPGFVKLLTTLSPNLRGLNSKWATVRNFTNAMSDHSIATIDGKSVAPDATPFQARMWRTEGEAMALGLQLDGMRKIYNGIDIDTSQAASLRQFNSTLNKKDPTDAASFGFQVAWTKITNTSHSDKVINEAANLIGSIQDKYYRAFLDSQGLSYDIPTVRNALGYFTQSMNKIEMRKRPEEWNLMYQKAFREMNAKIRELKAPIDNFDAKIKDLSEKILTGKNVQANQQALKQVRVAKKKYVNNLIAQMRDDESIAHLMDKRVVLNSQEAAELKKLLKPQVDLEKKIKKSQDKVKKLQKEHSLLKFEITKHKKSESKVEAKKRVDELNPKLKKLKKDLDSAKKERDNLKERLQVEKSDLEGRALAGELNPHLYYINPETGFVHFNSLETPKFVKVPTDDIDIMTRAQSDYEAHLNLTDSDILMDITSSFHQSLNPDSTMERKILIPQKYFLEFGFQNTDLPSMMASYMTSIGKLTHLNNSLTQFSPTKRGMAGVSESLLNEYNSRLEKINSLPEEKRAKARIKLGKEFDKQKEFVNDLYNAHLGIKSDSPRVRRITSILRTYAASTMLNSMPLTQISDLMGLVFHRGIFKFVRDGLLPSVTSVNGKLRTEAGTRTRRYASEALVAMEHLGSSVSNKFYGHTNPYDLDPVTKTQAAVQSMARISNNVSLANYIDNAYQKMAAGMSQSEIMNLLFKYKEGKLSPREERVLFRAGIDPKVWADRFIQSFEQAQGTKGVFGGYQSLYYRWEDKEALVKMASAVQRQVRDAVIKVSPGERPFFMENSILGLFTLFTGYAFSAFNRFTLPLLQSPDANKIIATIGMTYISSFEGILRKWARGEEADLDDEDLFLEAFSNSAPLSMLYKTAMFANGLTDNEFMDNMVNDKYRNITSLGAVGGPVLSLANNYLALFRMGISGKFNREQWLKSVRLLPIIQPWYLQSLTANMFDTAFPDLPETKQQAQGWFE